MHDSHGPAGQRHNDDASIQQGRLFDIVSADPPLPHALPLLARAPQLTAESPLGAARLPYEEYLRLTDRSKNTITCFLSDLGLLIAYLGADIALGAITPKHLEDWRVHLVWERSGRGPAPAPKTMARRVTFLKNFFGWLAQEGTLTADPSAELVFRRPLPPLPELLFEDELRRLEAAASEDVRCHLLVRLLLEAGLKKEELLGLRLRDVDLSDPQHPAIEVHFPGQDKRRRERRMSLSGEWAEVYQRYVARYRPVEHVFECTGRNLNYVLVAAVRRAKIERRVTLQLLRDVYAVRQLRAGVPPETLREKLGLSEEAWIESAEKYRKLAFSA
jgi:site-specific recombinase XerD